MELRLLNEDFTVCKVVDYSQVSFDDPFVFLAKTDEECSLVCQSSSVPVNTLSKEDGFSAFKIQGVLDFSLIGILSPIAQLFCDAKLAIFVVSTYNTDYILVKKDALMQATEVLKKAGYIIV